MHKAEPLSHVQGHRGTMHYQKLQNAIFDVLGHPDSTLRQSLDHWRAQAFQVGGMLNDPDVFRLYYLKAEGLKRYQRGAIAASERRNKAIAKFREAEHSCGSANVRLHDVMNKPIDEEIRKWLGRAQTVVTGMLGCINVENLPRHAAFSGGASTEHTRLESHPSKKWGAGSHITRKALPYGLAFWRWSNVEGLLPEGFNPQFQIRESNEVFTVPKNFERDRTCGKEPTWNMFFQKGVGSMIRERLQLEGLLSPDAQEVHARLAREASIDRKHATIDLAAASDTISLALCELLLPPRLLKLVMDLRSDLGEVDGVEFPYEKVSSMGNGYTFELETALFYALARAVCGNGAKVSVYGDDIIVPVEYADSLEKLFRFCGFETNTDKTFTIGPFRESCGGHFFDGKDVTPFYVEQLPRNIPEVIDLHNRALAWAERHGSSDPVLPILREARRLVPRKYWGPRSESGVLWCEWDEARPSLHRQPKDHKKPWFAGSWVVKGFKREKVSQRHDYYVGGLLSSLWGSTVTTSGSYVDLRLATAWHVRRWAQRNMKQQDASLASEFHYETGRWRERAVILNVSRQWAGPSVTVGYGS